jgi:hypothetical protein
VRSAVRIAFQGDRRHRDRRRSSTRPGQRVPRGVPPSVDRTRVEEDSAVAGVIMVDELSGLRDGYAEVGDQRLHYVEAGEGPLVILLHGFPEFWYGWR